MRGRCSARVCQTSVLELIYHIKSVSEFCFFFFFQMNLCNVSQPHIHTESISVWTAWVRWCSERPAKGKLWQSFESPSCKNNQSEMNKKAIIQRELWRITRGILVFSIWLLGPFQTFSSSSISTHQLCIPATAWTRRGKLDPEVTFCLGSKICRW